MCGKGRVSGSQQRPKHSVTPESSKKIRMHGRCIPKGDIKFSSSLESFDVQANNPIYINSTRGYSTRAAFSPKISKDLLQEL